MGPTSVETAEITGLGGNLVWYRRARAAGHTHVELVEITSLGGALFGYRLARTAGYTHTECVEILEAGGNLNGYRLARAAGHTHTELVEITSLGWGSVLVPGGTGSGSCARDDRRRGDGPRVAARTAQRVPRPDEEGTRRGPGDGCVRTGRRGWVNRRSDTAGMEPSAAETAEAAGLGVNLVWYRRARAVGCTHGECVEIVALGGSLYGYRLARNAGCSHATLIGAVRRHGLPAGLLNGFLDRISATPGADVATVVFETVADCSG